MAGVRRAFLDAVDLTRPVVASAAVAACWDRPSVLAEFTVRGLAGHLVRAAAVVATYLEPPAPEGDPIAAPAYFAQLQASPDPMSAPSVSIRERGEAEASAGHAALARRFDELAARLPGLLASEPEGRPLRVFGGQVMRLDDYLLTRLVEVTVHADDLALSVGLEPPRWPREVANMVIAHLVEVSRLRHGDLAVLRALTRRERDHVEALRVF